LHGLFFAVHTACVSSPKSWQSYAQELHKEERRRYKAAQRRRVVNASFGATVVLVLFAAFAWLVTLWA
jgi:hypothetical protein